jgi:plastocyanin
MVVMRGDTVEIPIEGLRYGQEALEVSAGTTVRWVNRDQVQHTVTSDDGRFGSGLMDPDGSWSYTFESPGQYPYHCIPHPFMKARVTVTEREGGHP